MDCKECEGRVPKVRVYRDAEGVTYKVMPGVGEGSFVGRRNRAGSPCWRKVSRLAQRSTFEEAQVDLDELAARSGWRPTGRPDGEGDGL